MCPCEWVYTLGPRSALGIAKTALHLVKHELRKVEGKNRILGAEVVWRSGDERVRQKREEGEKDHL